MSSKKKITIRGVEYCSIKEAASALGLHYGNLVRRLRSGWSIDQCLGIEEPPKRTAHNKVRIKTSAGSFSSIRNASVEFGILESTIQRRLSLGWTHDQAVGLTPPPQKRPRAGVRLTCEGRKFASYPALARHYKVNPIRTAKRIRSGWSVEQAVGISPPPPRFRNHDGSARNHLWKHRTEVNRKAVIVSKEDTYRLYVIKNKINGREYIGATTNSIKTRWNGHKRQAKLGTKSKLYNALRKYGPAAFSIDEVRSDAKNWLELQEQEISEIKRRKTLEQGYNTAAGGAIGTPKPILIDGLKFGSQQAAALHFGIDPSVFNLRINRLGWTPEEAAELKSRTFQRIKVELVNGEKFESLQSASKFYGLDYKLVHDRYRSKHWTLEQSLGIEDPPRLPKKKVTIFGQEFDSVSHAARTFGLKPDTLSARLRRGLSPEESVTIDTRRGPKPSTVSSETENS